MTDHSDLIARLQKELQRGGLYSSAGVITRDITALLEALSSQSLSLSEARAENDRKDAEIERLKGLVAGIREIPQEPWQDIATAPKDGTRVLLTAFGGQIAICFWHDCWLYHGLPDTPVDWWDDPSHWMPLPAAPTSALENGAAGLADATSNPPLSDLSSLRKGAEVAVKPLEWEDGYAFVPGWSGHYRLIHYPGRKCWSLGGHGFPDHPRKNYATEAEAKSAAQSDFETRIRSALVSGSREEQS